MAQTALGKSKRNGITPAQLFDMFPDEQAMRLWFESGLQFSLTIAQMVRYSRAEGIIR